MIALTAAQIAEAVSGTLSATLDPATVLVHVTPDSREVTAEGTLYVAKPGERADGHDFIDAALGAGAAAVLAVAALGLTACAGDEAGSAPSASDASSVAPATGAAPASDSSSAASTADGQAAGLTITDPWTKATEEGMTGSFGMLENSSDQDLHIVGVRSELGETVELHEMVSGEDGQMVMQRSPDGFTVPAGGSFELAPGGNHVMFMGLTDPIEPGEDVTYDLEL